MKNIIAITMIATLASCAAQPYMPLVDLADGQTQTQYNDDVNECRRLANTRMSASQGAGAGAIAGALIGGAIMAAMGGNADSIGRVAGAGAVAGAAHGGVEGHQSQAQIMNNCMAGRGYRVL